MNIDDKYYLQSSNIKKFFNKETLEFNWVNLQNISDKTEKMVIVLKTTKELRNFGSHNIMNISKLIRNFEKIEELMVKAIFLIIFFTFKITG
jgi:hypothetical protein